VARRHGRRRWRRWWSAVAGRRHGQVTPRHCATVGHSPQTHAPMANVG
jgi:hypothetical protein